MASMASMARAPPLRFHPPWIPTISPSKDPDPDPPNHPRNTSGTPQGLASPLNARGGGGPANVLAVFRFAHIFDRTLGLVRVTEQPSQSPDQRSLAQSEEKLIELGGERQALGACKPQSRSRISERHQMGGCKLLIRHVDRRVSGALNTPVLHTFCKKRRRETCNL